MLDVPGLAAYAFAVPAIRNDDDLSALSAADRLRFERAYRALRTMRREHVSVEVATELADAEAADVEEFFGEALGWDAGRRVVRSDHRLPLPFNLPTQTGARLFWVSDPEIRSLLGGYDNAKDAALAGDERALRSFEGRSVVVGGERIPLITDVELLTELAQAGEIGFESIYELG